ncbi:RNA polymerase sigma factor [Sulfurisoma sediminicola]|uniref:RNA polymerase sigma-70 factor (ECF subfamily) n=1 Tax=Sulfurisoma sediminicola TaxID=1381557 RepID=A0A497XFD0_9PROT|nr:RNA polymerase sigma factor [Sulfurisoma sediminicola]RLJ64838.1 RNA polymerase sigma-70 factor (ECF subfamily) [Sulfurisoma sediminicola]
MQQVSDPRSDEALMLAYRDGDAAAFDLLYERWRGRLYRYLLHQVGAAAIADEIYQDIWMRVIGARGHYEVTARFSTWLFRIARNRLVDHWRRLGREIVDTAADFEATDPEDEPVNVLVTASAAPEENPERRAERAQLATQLIAAIEALPTLQRDAFLMAEEGGMTLEEIAAATGTGRETVKSRLRYALVKLRSQLGHWR